MPLLFVSHHKMYRVLRMTRTLLIALLAAILVFALAFEFIVVRPALIKTASQLATATPSERNPPATVLEILGRSQPELRKYQVARNLLTHVEGFGTIGRHFAVLGLGIFLSLHLSAQELAALHISQAYMGTGVHGFAQASVAHLGVPLESVTIEQAAKLVAISYAPSAYLTSPERLARRTEFLLAARRQ
jgi:hypothetical protein